MLEGCKSSKTKGRFNTFAGAANHSLWGIATGALADLVSARDCFGHDLHTGGDHARQFCFRFACQKTSNVHSLQDLPTIEEFLAIFDGAISSSTTSEVVWPATSVQFPRL